MTKYVFSNTLVLFIQPFQFYKDEESEATVSILGAVGAEGITINWWTYLTFGCYLVLMIGAGIYFMKRAGKDVEGYLLGGRGLGSWVTALSAQASDMSGWLLMGLPGAVYFYGINQAWVAIGLLLGTLLNWLLVAPRLRAYTGQLGSLTLNGFIDRRFRAPKHVLRIVGSLLTLFFFTIYTASGLVATGKLFETMFHFNYLAAVLVGAGVMIFYTLLGGFLAVCWTDLFQGILMFFAVLVLPAYAMFTLPAGSIEQAYLARGLSFSLLPPAESAGAALVAVISLAAWGLGYFGQPHILVRFMGIKSVSLLPRATTIAMIWVVISLSCAVWIGMVAVPMFENLSASNAENVFIYMIGSLFHPLPGGILLAAILAAIMSTIDSQLLVSSSSLTDDLYVNLCRPGSSDREQLLVNRLAVVVIMIIACSLAAVPDSSIFDLVKFAWSGFGAAFGPAVLAALYSRRTGWIAILCGMLTGAAALLVWRFCGHGNWMYEIVPGFLANAATIWVVNRILRSRNPEMEAEFDRMLAEVKGC